MYKARVAHKTAPRRLKIPRQQQFPGALLAPALLRCPVGAAQCPCLQSTHAFCSANFALPLILYLSYIASHSLHLNIMLCLLFCLSCSAFCSSEATLYNTFNAMRLLLHMHILPLCILCPQSLPFMVIECGVWFWSDVGTGDGANFTPGSAAEQSKAKHAQIPALLLLPGISCILRDFPCSIP